MKRKKTILTLLLLAGMSISALHAQQSANAAGGDATGSGGSASYSIGQVVYTAATGSSATSNQGVQQPYEFFVTGISETPGIGLEVSAFPNPTPAMLNLKVEAGKDLTGMSYELFDITGKQLLTRQVTASLSQIAMQSFASGTYMLRVLDNQKTIQSFTIIKNQ